MLKIRTGKPTQTVQAANLFRHPQIGLNAAAGSTINPVDTRTRTRDAICQTDYRDSEAQTDPWTPPFEIPAGQPEPDILALLSFTYGNGLPAGAHEVAMIEKAQRRREAEQRLPPPSDPNAFQARVQFFAKCELEDWVEREDEVRAVQDRRIEMLKTALKKRDARHMQAIEERLRHVRDEKQRRTDDSVNKIERTRIKTLRHLTYQVKEPMPNRHRKRDYIQDYYDYKSKAYAPLPRDGQVADHNTEKLTVRNVYNETVEGLDVLERDLPLDVLMSRAMRPAKVKPHTQSQRVQAKIDSQIRSMEAVIRQKQERARSATSSEKKEAIVQPTEEKKKKTKHIPVRPTTPNIDQEEDVEKFEGALLLQRLLRGRAVQTMMLEGKEKRSDLIRELRMEEQLREISEQMPDEDEIQEQLRQKKEEVARQICSSALGDVVSQALDTLSKELVRFREERRISAMVQLAERSRRLREAAESGRRQEEEERREREDERMRQVMHTQHRTVDAFLESVIADSCDAAAKKNAVMEARVLAGILGDVLYDVERRNPEVVVRDLVSSFLFPEVERGLLREQVKREQKRFVETARTELQQAVKESADQVK
ncbi:MAG: putative cilia- and flagella-associated protein 91 [Streblomastix strix]|uniref:Cilia- and flagella-associated protein 91 n=1 Tax=Streblomastix strix TaxID=222440 RepID=A0A5J4VV13_9EUKA|nr:MAG: putative cilia- and flagella-associated protein 91 [Streblomastix strix]